MSLMRPASALIDLQQRHASCTSTAHFTMASAMSRICGVNAVTSNSLTDLAVFCIWSMELSIEVIRSRMLPRSNGVMKVRRTAISTSRVTLSASFSRSITIW